MKLVYTKPKYITRKDGRQLQTHPHVIYLKDGPFKFRLYWGAELIYKWSLQLGKFGMLWEV